MALTDNLVSFWELGEASGGGARADSVIATANDLGASGTPTQAAPLISVGNAIGVSASNYVAHVDNASLSITGSFTIAAWLKATSLVGADRPVWSKWDSAGNQRSYILYYEDGSDAYVFGLSSAGTSGDVFLYFLSAPVADTPYFLVCTYDGVNANGYVNAGAPTSTAYSSGIFNSTANFEIGAWSTLSKFFTGSIDQVGLWNRALTSTEITALYSGGSGMSYAAMVSYVAGSSAYFAFGSMPRPITTRKQGIVVF